MSRPSLAWSLPLALGLALVATGRAFPQGQAVGMPAVDGLGSWWFQWWVARSVAAGEGLGHTDLLFWPWGKDVALHTGANYVDTLLIAPIRLLAGGLWAWNLLALLILVSNGVAAAALGRRGGRWGMVAATVIGCLHPYVLYELTRGRPTQAMLAPMLCCLLLAERAFAEGGRGRLLGAGALLALSGWTYWFGGLFTAFAVGILGFGQWRRLAGVAAVALLGVSPMLLALLSGIQTPGMLPVESWWGDTASLVAAEGDRVRLNVLDLHGAAGFIGGDRWDVEGLALGASALFAALLAPWRWRIIALVGLVLAIGPFPGGLPNPVYVGLANLLPPVARLYWPVRAVALLVPVAAVGASRRLGPLAAVLLLAEGLWRTGLVLPTWTPATPAPIAALATEEGAVLSLPYGRDQWALVHQTEHGRPLFNGMHERFRFLVPGEQRAFREENSFVAALLLAPQNPRAESAWTSEDAEAFRALGYRWVVLRLEPLTTRGPNPQERRLAAIRRLESMLGPPRVADDEAVVWALEGPAAGGLVDPSP